MALKGPALIGWSALSHSSRMVKPSPLHPTRHLRELLEQGFEVAVRERCDRERAGGYELEAI